MYAVEIFHMFLKFRSSFVLLMTCSVAEELHPVVFHFMIEPGISVLEYVIIEAAVRICAHVRLQVTQDMVPVITVSLTK